MTRAVGNLWETTCEEQVSALPLDEDCTVDLAVIGGGFTGCSAALEAAGSGASVCLVEAQEIGHGGSGRNVGLVNAGLWLPPEAITRILGETEGGRLSGHLASAPNRVFDLIAKYNIACEAVRNGTLHCAHSKEGLRDLEDRYRQQAALDAPVTLLDGKETQRRTGSPVFHGALHDARAGTINPLAYCRGLARAAAKAGARLCAQTPATGVRQAKGGWVVETPGGTITAGALLVATNAYHQQVSGMVSPETVPVHFFQVATEPLGDNRFAHVLPGGEGCWDTALVMSSFRRDAAGRLLVGAVGDLEGFGGGIHRDWARRMIHRIYPALGQVEIGHAWCGRIGMTGDHLPKILDIGPNAYACFGYSGRGIGPGTTFGTLAAQALLKDDPALLPLSPVASHGERFSGLRSAYYETGAVLTHALKARV